MIFSTQTMSRTHMQTQCLKEKPHHTLCLTWDTYSLVQV